MDITRFKHIAEKHKLPASRLSFNPHQDPKDPMLSKLLGIPYWESGVAYPKDKNGKLLGFLCQIDCSRLTWMESVSFPGAGLLQFFVSKEDAWGLDFNDQFCSGLYHVQYWPEPDIAKLDRNVFDLYSDDWDAPVFKPLGIDIGHAQEELCGLTDEYYSECFYGSLNDIDDETLDEIFEAVDNAGSKIGGYAYFTQSDPRSYNSLRYNEALGLDLLERPKWILLLQLDSDHEEMMWGDCGVANWFIQEKDLKSLRFDRVLYNWDCC